jgi:hypothetical protein
MHLNPIKKEIFPAVAQKTACSSTLGEVVRQTAYSQRHGGNAMESFFSTYAPLPAFLHPPQE